MKIKTVLKYFIFLFCFIILQTSGFGETPQDKVVNVAKYKGSKITMGTQGGRAKVREEIIILRSGQIYDHNIDKNEYTYVKTLTGKNLRNIFSIFNGVAVTSFNHPGTISTFVEEDHNGKINYYYIWGEEGVEVPGYILSGYTEMLKIIK